MSTQSLPNIVLACTIYYRLDNKDGYVHRLLECQQVDQDQIIPLRYIHEKSDDKLDIPCEDPRFANNVALLDMLEQYIFNDYKNSGEPLIRLKHRYQRQKQNEDDYSLVAYRKKLSDKLINYDPNLMFPCPSLYLPPPLDSYIYPQPYLLIGIENGSTKISFRRLREWIRIYGSLAQWSKWSSYESLVLQQNKLFEEIWKNNDESPYPESEFSTCFLGLLPKRTIVPPQRIEREEFHEVLSATIHDIIINQEKADKKKYLASQRSTNKRDHSQI